MNTNTTPPRTPSQRIGTPLRNSRRNNRRRPRTPSRNSRNNRRHHRTSPHSLSPPPLSSNPFRPNTPGNNYNYADRIMSPISPPRTPSPPPPHTPLNNNPHLRQLTPSPSPPPFPLPPPLYFERYNPNTPSPNSPLRFTYDSPLSPNVNLFQNDDEPTGVAFEVHNQFNKHFAKNNKKYFEIISPFTKEDNHYLNQSNIIEHVQNKLNGYIYEHYVKQEIQPLKEKLDAIFERVKNTEYIAEQKYRLLIGKTVDFVLSQEEDFIKFYLSAFSHDCYHAYSGQFGMSCVKGILERFYLLIGDTAFALCPDTCENETYEKLKKLFNKKIDKNELTQEWANTYLESDEIKELSVENRKKHYISFMIEKYKEADLYDDAVKEEIQKEADAFEYAFKDLAFGGRKKKRRTIKNKKTKKSKRKSVRRTKK